jgi:hypothetical protein
MAPLLGAAQTGECRKAVCQELGANAFVVVLEGLLKGHGRLPDRSVSRSNQREASLFPRALAFGLSHHAACAEPPVFNALSFSFGSGVKITRGVVSPLLRHWAPPSPPGVKKGECDGYAEKDRPPTFINRVNGPVSSMTKSLLYARPTLEGVGCSRHFRRSRASEYGCRPLKAEIVPNRV